MKIVYDHQIFGAQEYGGISRYFVELASKMSLIPGNDVTILAPWHINRYLENLPPPLRLKGRPIRPFPYAGHLLRPLNNVLTRQTMAKSVPEIFHETYYNPLSLAPQNAKTVLTVYDMIHEKFPESFSFLSRTSLHKKKAVLRANHVVCISESTRNDLLEYTGIPMEKTSVIYLGHSLRLATALYPPPMKSRPFILYVGQRRGYKNFNTLLEAFATSPLLRNNFCLVAFGGGPWTKEERENANRWNINEKELLRFSGNDDLLSTLYEHAEVFVFPSFYEGFGIPPLEAMAHGCPVVCSNLSSLPEVVGSAARMINPHQPEDLRNAVEELVSSSEERKRWIEKGKERIKLFSWERCALETQQLYKKVLFQ